MFISNTHKLIFLEVPRTASRSISQALMVLDPEAPTAVSRREKGASADYHGFSHELLDNPEYRVVATHRNPYDRLWSFWKHRNSSGNPPIFKQVDWPSYVHWACNPSEPVAWQNVMPDVPIAEMFDLERVDHWLEFDRLGECWNELAESLQLALPSLNFMNSSPERGGLSEAYTPDMAAAVFRRFQADFDYFGYREDSWQPAVSDPESPGMVQTSSPATRPEPASAGRPKPRVAILTTFADQMSAFSLHRVVQDQLAMLVKHGYAPTVLVVESDSWDQPAGYLAHDSVTVAQYRAVQWISQEDEDQQFLADIETLQNTIIDQLDGVDVVITHDVIYIPTFIKLFIACRRIAEQRPSIKWLHWIHSATGPEWLKKEGMAALLYDDLLAQPWPGSFPVFFNRMSIPRIAQNFSYEEADVQFVPHPTNICEFLGLGEIATRLYEEKRLYLADHVTVVPVRLDRGKQVDWIIRIMAGLKALGERVRVIIMDFHSVDEAKQTHRKELRALAREWGLEDEELIFMSEFDKRLESEAPHGMVRELFSLATVFIQPSRSESYSLSTQEAALCGNLLVLNDDFPPFREMFGEDALYFQFSANIDRIRLQDGDTQLRIEPLEFSEAPLGFPMSQVRELKEGWVVSGEAAHAQVIAHRIRYEFKNNRVLRQRQKRLRDRNLFSVFSNHLEPVLQAVANSGSERTPETA